VFTGEQGAYCVGDASQAQHDNGEISECDNERMGELASELISANLRSFLPKPFTKKTASLEAVCAIYLTSFLLCISQYAIPIAVIKSNGK
jgi:hypothetical protein